jgi:alkanesulfonate monooxygenase SsuD/methylene tetrahydromethanopterin reductase-like flavin-dependent oxidoreductase (luciferase family)
MRGRTSLLVLAPAPAGDAAQVRAAVERLERLGVDGVFAGDHLFVQETTVPADTSRPCEPFTLLAAAGMASNRLILAVMVANIAIINPVMVARAGAQLAELHGGRRVWLGIGAGWNEPEFRALRGTMPGHRHRTAMLREAAEFLQSLYHDGEASLDGTYVHVDRLPLAPLAPEPPGLLFGGGSRAVLELGARYGDVVDLNAPFQKPLGQPDDGGIWAADARRRLQTTIGDLARAVEMVTVLSRRYDRPPPLFSINVDMTAVIEAGAVAEYERQLCKRWGLAAQSLAACPYVLIGTCREIAAKVSALRQVGIGAIAAEEGAEQLCEIRDALLADLISEHTGDGNA